jgi:hypothetical protein
MKVEFTQQEIDNYVKEKSFHAFYKRTCEIESQMCVHADGLFPEKLLYERRPNEPMEVLEYRKKIFSPKTKPSFSKIFSTLQKIRRSSDWSIKYEGEFPKIREGETLEEYCEHYYPGFYSLTNWVFTLLLRKYLIDPNAVVFVHPMTREVNQTDFLKPIAEVFDSKNVVDYIQDDYAVLVNHTGATYNSGNKPVKGKRYYFITTQQTFIYDQVNGRMQFDLVDTYDHGLGYLPCFQLKGIVIDQCENMYLYESKIAGVIPEFDEAIREYSDLQAAKVLHIYPERWEFTNAECTNCKGTGRVNQSVKDIITQVECGNCHGKGYVVAGPYSKIMIKPAGMGEKDVPTPPAGYVEKDVEIVRLMEESVHQHIYNGYAALSFEFLAEKPLATSGIKTAMDGDEMNNTVHGIAEDVVACMDNIYWLIGLYRYGQLYPPDDIIEMIPEINVPDKFDILSSAHTLEELASAKTNNVNPVIKSALEIAYASSRFNTDPEIRDRLLLILKLDPLPNITEDEKMSRLSNKGITLESYVISSNIQPFIQRALMEEKRFVEMDLEKQLEILNTYAAEVIALTEPAIIATPDTGLGPDGQPIDNTGGDNTGKIPLAVQQLSLAASRATDAGDTALAASIKVKINQLLAKLVDSTS